MNARTGKCGGRKSYAEARLEVVALASSSRARLCHFGVYAILYTLHAIEVKLNKLLDHFDLSVPDWEIAKDR